MPRMALPLFCAKYDEMDPEDMKKMAGMVQHGT